MRSVDFLQTWRRRTTSCARSWVEKWLPWAWRRTRFGDRSRVLLFLLFNSKQPSLICRKRPSITECHRWNMRLGNASLEPETWQCIFQVVHLFHYLAVLLKDLSADRVLYPGWQKLTAKPPVTLRNRLGRPQAGIGRRRPCQPQAGIGKTPPLRLQPLLRRRQQRGCNRRGGVFPIP